MNKLSHTQIADLVVQAQNGDSQAFAALYTATVDRQLYFATAFLKDKSLAEDTVQEVYIKMFKNIKNLDNPRVFVAYLNRICYNTCVDYKKKYFSHKYELNEDALSEIQEETPDSLPQVFVENKDAHDELYGAIYQLPEQQKSAFLLRYYYNMKIREVAQVMSVSESTVKRAIKSATASLKTLLSPKEQL